MDIKYPSELLQDYKIEAQKVKNSIEMIMNSGKEYEFRTTYVKGIHSIEDAKSIGKMIEGAKNYYIQNFRAGKTIDPELNESNTFTEKELTKIKEVIAPYVKSVKIR
jgi:pyruvate formate lyase activating enzyme